MVECANRRTGIHRVAGFVLPVALAALSACSVFPYDSHYLCETTADFGRCASVDGAYRDALSGNPHSADARPLNGDHASPKPAEGSTSHAPAHPDDAAADYRQAQYRALAGLINAPVSPVLAPARMLRTLIVAYEDSTTPVSDLPTLYMPRLVYYVVEPPHFVLSDRFADSAPGVPMLYPNGAPRQAPESRP